LSTWKVILCVAGAVLAHVAILLFGGILFLGHGEEQASKRDVEIVTESVDRDREEQEKQEQDPEEKIEAKDDAPPDPDQSAPPPDAPAGSDEAPALDAASLSAIENALNGAAGAGGVDFGGGGASLQSGGQFGGTGRGGGKGSDDQFQGAFSMSEIDQRPRAVFQVAGSYPSEMRARKVEGVVTLLFIVDETGRVVNPRVEKSSHPEFEAPAVEALRQWKFEPAIKAGKRVSCRMRVPIRFQPR